MVSQKKKRRKINTLLSDRNRYGRRFLIPLNDEIKKYSSLVGYVISRYIRLEGKIKYMVFNEECGSFPDECKVIILNL